MNTQTIKAAWRKVAACAMVAAGAAIPTVAFADTVVINGVTWTYTPNEADKTLTLELLPKNTEADITTIPWSLVITGVTYKVTSTSSSLYFYDNRVTGNPLVIPDWVELLQAQYMFAQITTLRNVTFEGATTVSGGAMFRGCRNLQTVWFKGAANVAMNATFREADGMKVMLAGPDAKATKANETPFRNSKPTGCKVYLPTDSSWDNFTPGGNDGADIEVLRYGEGLALDLDVDESAHTITATCATTNALAAVLASAQYFKSGMGLDTRINVTNALDIAAGTITAGQLEYATFNSLMLAAKNQSQLDGILGVVPATVPVSIDPTGATQNLTVSTSDGRKVYVLLPEGKTYKLKPDGLVISFY